MTIEPRALFAESLGTGLLLFIIVGSGIVADGAQGDGVLALFAHAVVVGAGLAALIAFLAPVSGAHFNPSVSLGFALDGSVGVVTALTYAGAQVAGAVVGVGLAHATFGNPILAVSMTERAGAGQLAAEFVATFVLVLLILGLVRSRRSAAVAPVVGAWVTAIVFATVSTGFANPAVTLARTVTDTYTGIAPGSAAGFLVAQLGAGVAAAYAASFLFPRPTTTGSHTHRAVPARIHEPAEEAAP